jgi:hypothetical protein
MEFGAMRLFDEKPPRSDFQCPPRHLFFKPGIGEMGASMMLAIKLLLMMLASVRLEPGEVNRGQINAQHIKIKSC